MLRSPRPPSVLGIYSLSVSLCGWYILFIVIIFCLFLSIRFSSSFVHFSIPALYLTKDTARKSIAAIIFSPFPNKRHCNETISIFLLKTIYFTLENMFQSLHSSSSVAHIKTTVYIQIIKGLLQCYSIVKNTFKNFN